MKRVGMTLAILVAVVGLVFFLVRDNVLLISSLVQGRVSADKGDQGRALEIYEKAVALNPRLWRAEWLSLAYWLKGSMHRSRGELDEAVEALKVGWELRPQSAQVSEGLALALFERGVKELDSRLVDLAIGDLTKALELNPKFTEAYYQRGLAYEGKGSLEAAHRDYDRVVELDAKMVNAYYHRGLVRLALGNSAGAINDLEWATQLNGNFADAFLSLGVAYRQVGKQAEAVTALQKVLTLTSDGNLLASAKRELAALQYPGRRQLE